MRPADESWAIVRRVGQLHGIASGRWTSWPKKGSSTTPASTRSTTICMASPEHGDSRIPIFAATAFGFGSIRRQRYVFWETTSLQPAVDICGFSRQPIQNWHSTSSKRYASALWCISIHGSSIRTSHGFQVSYVLVFVITQIYEQCKTGWGPCCAGIVSSLFVTCWRPRNATCEPGIRRLRSLREPSLRLGAPAGRHQVRSTCDQRESKGGTKR